MPSSVRSIIATGSKWRLTSIINPRQGKRGASSILTAGTLHVPFSSLTSCRNVSMPCIAPTSVAAVSVACEGVICN